MMSSLLFSLLTLFSLTLQFEQNDPGETMARKQAYYLAFSEQEKSALCDNNDEFACVLLFLNRLNDEKNDTPALFSFITKKFKGNARDVAVYLLMQKRMDSTDPHLLRIILAEMSEHFSKKLYPLYLKKLYYSGARQDFLEEYGQNCSSSLTIMKTQLLVNQGRYQEAFDFINDLPCTFGEWTYGKIDSVLAQKEKSYRTNSLNNEFRLWKLHLSFKKVRYKSTRRLADSWFPHLRKGRVSAWRGRVWRAKALTKQRIHGSAVKLYKSLEKNMETLVSLPEADIIRFFSGYGYSLAALGRNEASKQAYLKGFNLLNQSSKAAGLLFDAADMARIDGQFGVAEQLYTQLLELAPDHKKRGISEFLQFWMLWRMKKFQKASEYITFLQKRSDPNSYAFRRALYWRARTVAKLGDVETAKQLYRECYHLAPATWYGALAYTRIGGDVSIDLKGGEVAQEKSDILATTLFITALLGQKKQTVSRSVIHALAGQVTKKGSEIDRLLVAYATYRKGMYRISSRMLRSVASISEATRRYQMEHYPLQFQEDIMVNAGFYKVPPLFLLSLARQESFFNIKAVSSSYAIGLLQLLPSTAQILARSEGYGKVTVADLKKPLTNIRFASLYIRRLLNRFDERLPLAAGAYNAGSRKIKKWVNQKQEMELDEFIEDIPIFQTRNYVKKVMKNMASYHYLYLRKPLPVMNLKLPKPS
ncbi:transglycosylase SLT domain-containing protein [bacterium]|nr:transglycosylase SLT domain-containing protein [bacterium]